MIGEVLQVIAVAIVTSIPVMFLLVESVKRLPAATVYAAFVEIGVAGAAIVGMAVFYVAKRDPI
jgi:multidrug transporter EmrE-like cation transporter